MRIHSRFVAVSVGLAVLLTDFIAVRAQEPAPPPAVYVAAVRGDCWPGRSFAISPFGMLNVPGRARPDKTLLEHYSIDKGTRQTLLKELGKSRQLRLVSTLQEADFVLYACGMYYDVPLARVPQPQPAGPTGPLGIRVGVSSVENYLQVENQPNNLLTGTPWELDSTKPETLAETGGKKKKEPNPNANQRVAFINGQPLSTLPVISATEIARRFLAQLPALAPHIAAFAKPQFDANAEPRRPALVTDPTGDVSKTAPPKALEPIAADTALRIETALVVLPVMAMDKDGKFLPGLRQQDFSVFEDGVAQTIEEFGNSEKPIHVALVLDVSGSTQAQLDQIQDAALTFVEQLRPQDKVLVASFSTFLKVETEFTADRAKLTKAILRTRPGGATRIQDALDILLTERLSKIEGRKAIVLFTDGVDTASRYAKWNDVIARVQEAGVLVYPVRYDTLEDLVQMPNAQIVGATKAEYELARRNLQLMAVNSGGRYYEVANIGDAKQSFAKIAEELRHYYWLGYYPTNDKRDGRYRKIRVQVNRPAAVIRAREGYRMSSDTPAHGKGDEAHRPNLKNTKP